MSLSDHPVRCGDESGNCMHKPQTLSAIKSGKSVRILRMGPCQGMRTRLTEMGLMPGVMVEVQANLRSTGYDEEKLIFVKGMVEDTIPGLAPESIALLRLDTDWHASTRHELIHLYPRLQPGGVMMIDDYGHWQGARKAVDEYLSGLDVPLLLQRVDYTVRSAIKPG